MAGYYLYSLDFGQFQQLVEQPTRKQLRGLADLLSDELDAMDSELDEGDPVHDWPSDPEALAQIAAQRLALPDWYGDLSNAGKDIWSRSFAGLCQAMRGFKVESDGVYWTVINIATEAFKVPPETYTPEVALSGFGTRPYRYHPPPVRKRARRFEDDAWHPYHSMHTPDEVRQMLEEFRSIQPAIVQSGREDALRDYEEELMPVLERLAQKGRMLFVGVDT